MKRLDLLMLTAMLDIAKEQKVSIFEVHFHYAAGYFHEIHPKIRDAQYIMVMKYQMRNYYEGTLLAKLIYWILSPDMRACVKAIREKANSNV